MIVLLLTIIGVIVLAIIYLLIISDKLQTFSKESSQELQDIVTSLQARYRILFAIKRVATNYAPNQLEVFDDLRPLGGAVTFEEAIGAASQQALAIDRIIAIQSVYHKINSNSEYNDLFNKLQELNKEYTMYKQTYNYNLVKRNSYIETFPHNIVASMMNFKPIPVFTENIQIDKELIEVSEDD